MDELLACLSRLREIVANHPGALADLDKLELALTGLPDEPPQPEPEPEPQEDLPQEDLEEEKPKAHPHHKPHKRK